MPFSSFSRSFPPRVPFFFSSFPSSSPTELRFIASLQEFLRQLPNLAGANTEEGTIHTAADMDMMMQASTVVTTNQSSQYCFQWSAEELLVVSRLCHGGREGREAVKAALLKREHRRDIRTPRDAQEQPLPHPSPRRGARNKKEKHRSGEE